MTQPPQDPPPQDPHRPPQAPHQPGSVAPGEPYGGTGQPGYPAAPGQPHGVPYPGRAPAPGQPYRGTPQPGYPQPGYPPAGYPPPTGQPPHAGPPYAAYPPPGQPQGAPPPRRKNRTGLAILLGVIAVVAIAAGAFAVNALVSKSTDERAAATRAKFVVGACLTTKDSDEANRRNQHIFLVADCNRPDAPYRIAETRAAGDPAPCASEQEQSAVIDGRPMCLALNLSEGRCYQSRANDVSDVLRLTSCTATPGYLTVRVDRRAVALVECSGGGALYEYTRPLPISYCLSEVS